jgi:queuine tRNA-ribosyltransferase
MSGPFRFQVVAREGGSRARAGLFHTPHGTLRTPAFMPVGTRGSVKGIQPHELAAAGSQMILANAFHLQLRPGAELVRELGGLHRFMNWNGPILTDSGGYQVFSLAELNQIDDRGATFRSQVDGSRVRIEPEDSVRTQALLGADVAMAFDQCPAVPTDRAQVELATQRTHRWLERCVRAHRELGGEDRGQALFGIVQGGAFPDLRARSAEEVCRHDLVGYALGGVSVGEAREDVERVVAATAPLLPDDRPRYLMGVGTPRDFEFAVRAGVDLFDCVTPTRHGRTHQAFTSEGVLNLRSAQFARDPSPLDPKCDCPCCTGYSRAYLRHLARSGEMLAAILLTLHNLRHFHGLLADLRARCTQPVGP